MVNPLSQQENSKHFPPGQENCGPDPETTPTCLGREEHRAVKNLHPGITFIFLLDFSSRMAFRWKFSSLFLRRKEPIHAQRPNTWTWCILAFIFYSVRPAIEGKCSPRCIPGFTTSSAAAAAAVFMAIGFTTLRGKFCTRCWFCLRFFLGFRREDAFFHQSATRTPGTHPKRRCILIDFLYSRFFFRWVAHVSCRRESNLILEAELNCIWQTTGSPMIGINWMLCNPKWFREKCHPNLFGKTSCITSGNVAQPVSGQKCDVTVDW